MSPPPEEPGPEFPYGPDDLSRLEAMAAQPGNAPDMIGAAVEAVAALHVRWYRAWQTAGAPEQRAAEWAEVMIETMFQQST